MFYVITKDVVNKAIDIVNRGWTQANGGETYSEGRPAFRAERPVGNEAHTALAALQRAAGVRLYTTNKGWFTKSNYEGFSNRKAVDALALDWAMRHGMSFDQSGVRGLERLNNAAENRDVVIRFLKYLAGRVGNNGYVDTSGIKYKKVG